jgi:hypothetical protein
MINILTISKKYIIMKNTNIFKYICKASSNGVINLYIRQKTLVFYQYFDYYLIDYNFMTFFIDYPSE